MSPSGQGNSEDDFDGFRFGPLCLTYGCLVPARDSLSLYVGYDRNRNDTTGVSDPMSSAAIEFARQNQPRFLNELKDLLRIPSISTLPEHAGDVRRTAETLASEMRRIGLENVRLIETEAGKTRHPLVYGEWLHAAGKPTVLCYGHYDVQPPDPLDEWLTPPFEPTERNGNLYARGAVDDKGQMYMHLKALEALLETGNGTLPVNVRVILEGEEEVGGEGIAKFVREHPEALKADFALVSDTEMFAPELPTLCVGLRGMIYTEIEVRGREDGPALRNVWRSGAESVCGAGADHCGAEGRRGEDSDSGLLRRRGGAVGRGAGGVEAAAVRRGALPRNGGGLAGADGRSGLLGAGADVGTADAGCARDAGRLYRRRREDGDSG